MEQIYNVREDEKNIYCYVHFAWLCNVIKKFTELNHIFVNKDITLPLLLDSRDIKRRKQSWKFQKYMNQIYIRTYHDYKIDEIYLYDDYISKISNEILMTFSA